jgi:hypothetical protein
MSGETASNAEWLSEADVRWRLGISKSQLYRAMKFERDQRAALVAEKREGSRRHRPSGDWQVAAPIAVGVHDSNHCTAECSVFRKPYKAGIGFVVLSATFNGATRYRREPPVPSGARSLDGCRGSGALCLDGRSSTRLYRGRVRPMPLPESGGTEPPVRRQRLLNCCRQCGDSVCMDRWHEITHLHGPRREWADLRADCASLPGRTWSALRCCPTPLSHHQRSS